MSLLLFPFIVIKLRLSFSSPFNLYYSKDSLFPFLSISCVVNLLDSLLSTCSRPSTLFSFSTAQYSSSPCLLFLLPSVNFPSTFFPPPLSSIPSICTSSLYFPKYLCYNKIHCRYNKVLQMFQVFPPPILSFSKSFLYLSSSSFSSIM